MAEFTVLGVLQSAADWLERRGVDAPRRSAEWLLGRVLGLGRLELYLAHDRPLSEDERAGMRELMVRRGTGEPLAYVLGEWDFRGHVIEVGPAVLVPRPETEELVTLALERTPHGARVVELGTGSGCIAVAMALEREDVTVVATDASEPALEVARRNVERHGLTGRVKLTQGPWWEAVAGAEPFDLAVGNPPYVDPRRPELVQREVREFEPAGALFTAPGDPAAAYRAIAAGVEAGLRPDAWLVLETGVGAAEAARAVLEECRALEAVELRRDFAGQPRYLISRRSE